MPNIIHDWHYLSYPSNNRKDKLRNSHESVWRFLSSIGHSYASNLHSNHVLNPWRSAVFASL